jgi:hypothetical protein
MKKKIKRMYHVGNKMKGCYDSRSKLKRIPYLLEKCHGFVHGVCVKKNTLNLKKRKLYI